MNHIHLATLRPVALRVAIPPLSPEGKCYALLKEIQEMIDTIESHKLFAYPLRER